MKKSIFFAILGMALLGIVGCTKSKNAPDAFSSADLIGYWYRTYTNNSNAVCVEMWNFDENKTGAFADTNESNPIDFSFNWSISGDMLTISNSGGTIEMQIARLTSNELTLIVDNQRYNYIRYNPEEDDDITNSYFKVNNIAQFLSQTDKDEIICITGTVTVTYQNGLYLYVKDNSGSLLVYGSINKEYKNGDQIKGICGRYYSYYGLPEMKVEESTFGGIYKGNAPVSPEVVSSLSMNDLNKYVKFENVQFTADENFNSSQKTSSTLTNGILLHNYFLISANCSGSKRYNITGVVNLFKDAVELYPISIEEYSSTPDDSNDYAPSDVTNYKFTFTWAMTHYVYFTSNYSVNSSISYYNAYPRQTITSGIYTKTGNNKATMTLEYDNKTTRTFYITFTSPTSGTLRTDGDIIDAKFTCEYMGAGETASAPSSITYKKFSTGSFTWYQFGGYNGSYVTVTSSSSSSTSIDYYATYTKISSTSATLVLYSDFGSYTTPIAYTYNLSFLTSTSGTYVMRSSSSFDTSTHTGEFTLE